MAIEIAGAIAGPVFQSLMEPVKQNIDCMIFYPKNVREMNEKIVALKHRKNDVQAIMGYFKRNNLHIPSRAPSWLEEVEDIIAEVEIFSTEVNTSNLKDKHKYGKKALNIIERIKHLKDDEVSIKWTDHKFPVEAVPLEASTSEPSSPRHDSKVPTSSCDHDDFQSRKQTLTEALQSDHMSHMVTSCCMVGVEKTIMMEDKNKVVTKRKFFNFLGKKIVRDMNTKIVQLNRTRENVETHTNRYKSRNLEIPSRVPGWLKDVEDINALVESFPTDVGSCSLKIRHKLGKKAMEIIQDITSLIDEESRIKWTDSMKASKSTPSSHRDGFESRKQLFTRALKELESDHHGMVALCGMGGVGKTTIMNKLKQVVMERKIFDFVIEVVIGGKTNTVAIQQVIAAHLALDLAGGNKETRAIRLRELYKLYSDRGKKFLLVLDDVWQPLDLNDIGLSYSSNQGLNFKVLMSSRDRNVCINMGVEVYSVFNVEVLTVPEAQSFFHQLARISEDVDLDPDELHIIGNDIANRCHGLPLAIKKIAYTLKGQTKLIWKDALSRLKHGYLDELLHQVFETSYNNLENEETRSTLLLCGLFHEDFDISKEDLVRYAWGLNLFSNVDTIREARNRLSTNIDRLIDANLLIKSQDVTCVKMHSLVRTFVLGVCSKGEQASIVGSMSKWPEKHTSESCKRISLTCTSMFEFPRDCKYPNLLLLKLMNGDQSLHFHDDFYQEMGKLEVLAYGNMSCQVTSRSLQCSTNLRTLCFHRCSGMFDFSLIGDLLNLEVLSFTHSPIVELPSTIGKLKKLRLLDLTCCDDLRIDDGVLKNLVRLEELYMRHSGVTLELAGCKKKANNLRNANGDELAKCSKNLLALEIEFLDNNALPKGMSFTKLTRFKISLGCSLEEEEEYQRNRHSFENTLMLVTNKDQLLDFRMDELFEATQVLHLQVNDIRDGLVDSFYLHQSPFNKLRVLKVYKCVYLRYLFTVRVANSLTKLECLTVSWCPILETLLIDSENSGVEAIKFQALKFLSLSKLPKLMSFCNNVNTIELPQLEELILDSLPNFTSFYPDNISTFSMSNYTSAMQPLLNKEIVISQLKKMKISKMENLKVTWPTQFNNGGEVDALKEKMTSYEERLETEQRKREALEQQHKELANELTQQKALTEQLFAFKRQFQDDRLTSLEVTLRSIKNELLASLKENGSLFESQMVNENKKMDDKIDMMSGDIGVIKEELQIWFEYKKMKDDAKRAKLAKDDPEQLRDRPQFPVRLLWKDAGKPPNHP